jgi:hypothetical protein
MPFQFIPQEGLYAKEIQKEEERRKLELKAKEQQILQEKHDKYELSINPSAGYSNPPRENYSKTPTASASQNNTQLKDKSNITNKVPDSGVSNNNAGAILKMNNTAAAAAPRKNPPFEFTPKVGAQLGGNLPSQKNPAQAYTGANGTSFSNHFLSSSNSANNLGMYGASNNKQDDLSKINSKTPRTNDNPAVGGQSTRSKYEENYEASMGGNKSAADQINRYYEGQTTSGSNMQGQQYTSKYDEIKQKQAANLQSNYPGLNGGNFVNSSNLSSPNLLSSGVSSTNTTSTTTRTKLDEHIRMPNADEFAVKYNAAFIFQPSHALKK